MKRPTSAKAIAPALALTALLACGGQARAWQGQASAPASPDATADAAPRVARILTANDRALLKALNEYVDAYPRADDLDQAYLNIFEVVIKNDWFADGEAAARAYLASRPKGSVRSMAQIVNTMARAQAGRHDEALGAFVDLITGLDGAEQLEFASNFADSLAADAASAGRFDLARRVYRTLTDKFPDDQDLRAHAQDVLDRYERVGKPSPVVEMTDIKGTRLDLRSFRGKYVLIDFWATWCAPCQADLPLYQAAYKQYHDRGFEIVSVSLDEAADTVADFVRQRTIPWPQVHNATAGSDLVSAFAVGVIPSNVLLGPDGQVIRLDLRGKTLARVLDGLFSAPARSGQTAAGE